MVEFDFGQDTGPEVVPVGIHQARVVQAEEKKSQSGNPMWALTLQVDDPSGEKTYGYLYDYVVFTPKAAGLARKKLSALGFQVPKDGSPFRFQGTPNEAIGRYVRVAVIHEDWQGQTKAKVEAMDQGSTPAASEFETDSKLPF